MRTSSLNPRRATTAIAALLALTATPIVAQDAATAPLDGPIIGTPTTVTAPDPAPVLVIPDVSTVEEPAAEPVAASCAAMGVAVSASNAAIAVEARRGVSDEVRIAGIKPA